VTDAAASLRLVYGPNAAKKIARRFGIAVVTAKLWLAGRTPAARHEDIRRALLDECIRLEARLHEIRTEWAEVAGDDGAGNKETGRNGATEGAAAAVARGPADRGRPLVR